MQHATPRTLLAITSALCGSAVMVAGLTLPPARTASSTVFAQASADGDPPPASRPLPDIAALMHQVEQHQQLAEAVQKDYTYRSSMQLQRLDKHGAVKSVESRVGDVFYLEGIPVERTLEHNGKALSPGELKKEDDHIDRRVAKARERLAHASASGQETDAAGHDIVTVSRLLELGSFTNPRRVQVNDRSTIAVDFTGNPAAKTRTTAETVLHDMAGTIWIDEQDRAIEHLEGHFIQTFKLGAGLVADISQGTWFKATNLRINNEVWLPSNVEAHGHIRFLLLFNVDGNFSLHNSDYRKFKVTSRVLPAGSETPAPASGPTVPPR